MGRLVTLSDLREDVRTRYDLPAYSTTTYVTEDAVTRMINQSAQAFYAMLIACFGDDYFTTTASTTTTASVASTTLPTDAHKVLRVVWLKAADEAVTLHRATVDDYAKAFETAEAWNYAPRYRVHGSSLKWYPVPSAVYNIRIIYVALPEDLDTAEDTMEAGPGWDEWIVLDVCRKIAEREDQDASRWIALRADVEARIKAQAPERDESEPEAIRDTWCEYGPHGLSAWQLRNLLTTGEE
jgi:hypothetical protein